MPKGNVRRVVLATQPFPVKPAKPLSRADFVRAPPKSTLQFQGGTGGVNWSGAAPTRPRATST